MGRPDASSPAAEPGREPRFRPNVCRYLRGGLGVVPVHAAARAEPHVPRRRSSRSARGGATARVWGYAWGGENCDLTGRQTAPGQPSLKHVTLSFLLG